MYNFFLYYILIMELIFIIIIFILFYMYLNSNEKFEDNQTCSSVKLTSVDSGLCNSQLCPPSCKISLSKDKKNCYCVDDI
jgi:hypothetical protein